MNDTEFLRMVGQIYEYALSKEDDDDYILERTFFVPTHFADFLPIEEDREAEADRPEEPSVRQLFRPDFNPLHEAEQELLLFCVGEPVI